MDAASAKRYFSWAQIQKSIGSTTNKAMEQFKPTVIVAIAGGGLIPARLVRTFIKSKSYSNLPIQTIALSLYDDEDVMGAKVVRTQWMAPEFDISGHHLLLVDEVDDSRKTLAYACQEMLR